MVTLESIRPTCPALSPSQIASVFTLVLRYEHVPPDTQELMPGEWMMLWTADLLSRLNMSTPEARLMILKRFHRELVTHALTLFAASREGKATEAMHLGFADRRFVRSTRSKAYFDYTTLTTVDELPHEPLETIAYNVTVLFIRRLAECRRVQQGATVNESQQGQQAQTPPES
jgi:hypothetical protein